MMTDDTPAKPPRVWTFVGSYTQESGGEYWIVDGPRPTEKNKFDLVERSYASRLEQDLAFVKTQWKQTSDLLEQERNRLTAELAEMRKERDELLQRLADYEHETLTVKEALAEKMKAIGEYGLMMQQRDEAIRQADTLAKALDGLRGGEHWIENGVPMNRATENVEKALAAYREFLKERE